ncbi:MAG: Nif3-like dinuclear metal center hexameric protein [Marmoricola sp.]|nr:Nif3-like dinuclear metal center hexameric protein [Marmoricola sp.]MCW2838165.1 Nif3-like dinuclear metal center hexameric protein [Marmoricola sp.]
MPTLGQITALLDGWFPPRHADSWDAVGLVCGDPDADVRRILLAVDPVTAVVDEAMDLGAQLLVCHHPLLLKGVHGVAATDPKGRIVHRLVTAGCGLFTAHTNADSPAGGVSESLALALGLHDVRPLEPDAAAPMDKIVVFAPVAAAERLRTAMRDAGAGAIGDYDSASFTSTGQGRFRPLTGAQPAIGEVGHEEVVDEVRIETLVPRHLRAVVVAAMLATHPYEEPAYDVLELAALDEPDRGSGRIGRLGAPMTLADFARHVAGTLNETAHGVRVAGDPDQLVETVGLCGGAGDFLLDRARAAGVDVYLTSDLRHHPASELREHGAPALVDVAHWAAESTWLPVLRRRLVDALGDTVEVRVSPTNTDPWTFRV